MAGTKRDALRRTLADVAETHIRVRGLAALRARDVTKDAGCALGSLYNAFEDLDLLILAVNSRTLTRLDSALATALSNAPAPAEAMQNLARAYLSFAIENRQLWAALFDHRMPADQTIPDWHLKEHETLFSRLMVPIGQLAPALDEQTCALRARTIFSAVHGIVKLSLEDRFVALHPDALDSELTQMVDAITTQLRN
ncbi:MAG: TetR/AcrR family transcriptional regulator [Paracoccaceae bacterium]